MEKETNKLIIKSNTLNETVVIHSGKKELQENRFFSIFGYNYG